MTGLAAVEAKVIIPSSLVLFGGKSSRREAISLWGRGGRRGGRGGSFGSFLYHRGGGSGGSFRVFIVVVSGGSWVVSFRQMIFLDLPLGEAIINKNSIGDELVDILCLRPFIDFVLDVLLKTFVEEYLLGGAVEVEDRGVLPEGGGVRRRGPRLGEISEISLSCPHRFGEVLCRTSRS